MAKENLKTVVLKHKDKYGNVHENKYVEVYERVRYFNEAYPNGRIGTKIVSHQNGTIVMEAVVTPDVKQAERFFTGFAYEKESAGWINKTSYIENCETSAVGRALGFLGIGIEASIRSADEMRTALAGQTSEKEKPEIKEPEVLKKEPEKEKPSIGLPNKMETSWPKLIENFELARKALGDMEFNAILKIYNKKSVDEIKTALEANAILKIMDRSIEGRKEEEKEGEEPVTI